MEGNNNDIDNFERFLRAKTDEFRMYPSKRVWYSIYNDMHPGNRFPSISMSIVLIGFLFLVGYLNTNTESKKSTTLPGKPIAEWNNIQNQITPLSVPVITPISLNELSILPIQHTLATKVSQKRFKNNAAILANTIATITIQTPTTATIESGSIGNEEARRNTSANNNVPVAIPIIAENNTAIDLPQIDIAIQNTHLPNTLTNVATGTAMAIPTNPETFKTKENNEKASTHALVAANKKTSITADEKAWIEDYGMHKRPAVKRWAGKMSMQAYITPSIVYRTLRSNIPDKVFSSNNQSFSSQRVSDFVTNKPSIGIETGAALQLDVSKKIRLKAGLQFNYTRYNAHAYETGQPVSTSVTLSNDNGISAYESFRTSNYANTYGINPTKLHNETYQFSIPIGADVRIAALDNISWYAGMTIQPTVLLTAKSYIPSSDRRNYILDPSLLNRFNLNAGFETYISFKSNSGYTWQLGPQYRAQIFTTNSRIYSVEERLQNFGFKIGVTKRL